MSDILPVAGSTNYILAKPRYDLLGEAPSDKKEKPEHPIESFFNIRFSIGAECAGVFGLPDSVRHVHAYHRPEETYTLPEDTGGFLWNFDFGVGMYIMDSFEVALDFVYRDNWSEEYGRSSLWSDIETPATDYVGYRLHGLGLRPSFLIPFYKRSDYSRALINIGYINEWARISSGTDAYVTYPSGAEGGIQFGRQKSAELPEKLLAGVVYRGCMSRGESFTGFKPCGLVGEFAISFTFPLQYDPPEFGAKFLSLGLIWRPPHPVF
jgi:hypothetical protein